MPVNVTTVYTKDKLLRFNNYIMSSKKFFWITMAVCTVLVVGCFALLSCTNSASPFTYFCLTLILLLDIVYVFCYLLVPRFTVRKAKNLDTSINYSFDADCFHIQAANAYANETSTVQYSIITKIAKNNNDLYLFISRNQGYIVDLDGLSDEQKSTLKALFSSKLSRRKIKWA